VPKPARVQDQVLSPRLPRLRKSHDFLEAANSPKASPLIDEENLRRADLRRENAKLQRHIICTVVNMFSTVLVHEWIPAPRIRKLVFRNLPFVADEVK
jgi:hypothetical protein